VEPSAGGADSKDLWYTVLVNPGGSLLTPTQDHAEGGALKLSGLKEGVEYSFQAVANTAAGASKPSEPAAKLTLGCTGAGDVCHHGLCGFDADAAAKRCFCYQGWDGAACEVATATATKVGDGDGSGNKAGGGDANGTGAALPTGRVTFVVDQSCAGDDTQECALRFTVPLRLLHDASAAAASAAATGPATLSAAVEGGGEGDGGGWTALAGPEEAKALEGMLRRDLVHAMGVHKEQVALRSLHPLRNATASSSSSSSEGEKEVDDATVAADATAAAEPVVVVAPMALTFDVLYSPDPAATVQAFTALWAQPAGPLRLGLVTSNFDVAQDAEVLLVARDTPLANLPEGAIVNDRPLRRSLAVSLGAFLLIGAVLLVVARYSRRKLGVPGGGNGRRAGAAGGVGGVSMTMMNGLGSGASGGGGISVGGGHARVRRRSDAEELGGGLEEEEDEVVEVMEIRASTDSGSGSRLGLGSSRPSSRSAPLDDGASERLV
jgi:hypothetical protein